MSPRCLFSVCDYVVVTLLKFKIHAGPCLTVGDKSSMLQINNRNRVLCRPLQQWRVMAFTCDYQVGSRIYKYVYYSGCSMVDFHATREGSIFVFLCTRPKTARSITQRRTGLGLAV